MSLEYQSLLGTSVVSTNELLVDSRIIANELVLPNGAVDGYVLTSDGAGIASWQPDSTRLLGDAIGEPLANRVDTLAGGTIQVDQLVQLVKAQTLTNKTIGGTNTVTASLLRNDANTWTSLIKGIPEVDQVLTFDGELKFKSVQHKFVDEWTSKPYKKGNLVRYQNKIYQALVDTTQVPTSADWIFVIYGITNEQSSLLDTATTENIPNSLVKRDGTNSFKGNLIGNASTVTTNANLSGDITSVGNVTTASSNIVKTTANQTLTNKNLTGLSNIIEATAIRNAVWSVPFGGASLPATNQVLTYNGSSAVWQTPTIVTGVTTATPNTIMSRDSSANTAVNDITLRKIIANDGSGYPTFFAEDNNVRVGRGAGLNLTTGTGNTYAGFASGFQTTTGTRNTSFGQEALYTGNPQNTTAFGFRAGYFASGSSNCTFIGCEADTPNTSPVGNSIAIGQGAKVSTNDTIQLGNVSIATVNTSGKINCNGVASTSTITCPNLTASGNINVSGNANVSGVLVANNGINTWNFNPPTGGGAWLSWNRGVGGAGRTAFMNQQGAGVGGFEWLNYNSSNVLTSPNPLMELDRDGNLKLAGKLTTDTILSKASYWQQVIYSDTSTEVALPSGAYTPVSFNGELQSSAVGSASSAGFTVTIPGAYKFTISMPVSTGNPATNIVRLYLFVNGGLGSFRSSFITDSTGFLKGSFIFPLVIGDVVTWRASPYYPTGFTARFGAGLMDSVIMAERLN